VKCFTSKTKHYNAPLSNGERFFTPYKVLHFYERWYGYNGIKFLFELEGTLSFHGWDVTKDEKISFWWISNEYFEWNMDKICFWKYSHNTIGSNIQYNKSHGYIFKNFTLNPIFCPLSFECYFNWRQNINVEFFYDTYMLIENEQCKQNHELKNLNNFHTHFYQCYFQIHVIWKKYKKNY